MLTAQQRKPRKTLWPFCVELLVSQCRTNAVAETGTKRTESARIYIYIFTGLMDVVYVHLRKTQQVCTIKMVCMH